MQFSKLQFIFIGPIGFAGASQIMCSWMRCALSIDAQVVFVGEGLPFGLTEIEREKIRFIQTKIPHSGSMVMGGAVGAPDVLKQAALSNALMGAVLEGREAIEQVVWAHYLFPYVSAAISAIDGLRFMGVKLRLWVTPTGSDIWQLAPQLHPFSATIIRSVQIDRLITYSRTFADEILKDYGPMTPDIAICPPVVRDVFRPRLAAESDSCRKALGISIDEFVVSCHCNMRPVKNIPVLIDAVRKFSSKCDVRVVLLLIGPVVDEFNISEKMFRVHMTGVVQNPEYFMAASDVEANASWHDSFNLSLAEAMCMGIPVVTTDIVGIAPEIQKYSAGFLIACNAVAENDMRVSEKMCNAMEEIYISKSHLKKVAQFDSAIAIETFSVSSISNHIKKLLAN